MDNKCSVCGGNDCELGRQCKKTCKDCYMLKCVCKKENVVTFKPKERTMHEKLTEIFGSPNYITFNFTSTGAVAWWTGEGMTDEQLSYINKLMDIITTETIKNNSEIKNI